MRALPVLLAVFPTFLWADDIPLTSKVSDVVLYPQGATITRTVPFSAPSGQHQLILTDLPRSTPLESVRVQVAGGAVMGSITARRDYVPPRDTDNDAAIKAAENDIERLEDTLRSAEADVKAIRLEAGAAEARVAFLRQLGEGESVTSLDVSALRELVGMIGDETLNALQTSHDARLRADTAERGLKNLKEELEDARKALLALVPEDEDRAMLAVSIKAGESTEGSVIVTYNIDDAGWLPVYDLKLDRNNATLAIERGAFIEQYTGENWTDVNLILSTVRPSEQTDPSEVWPWLRRIYDQQQISPKSVSRVEMEMDSYAGALAEPMVETPIMMEEAAASFDGLAVTYTYPGMVSVASDADRLRLALGTLETSVNLTARAIPLSDPTAFLMANMTNDTGELILPTSEAMFYLDGRFIGQKYIEMIAAGAEVNLSFGPIEGLRLTRTVLDRNEGDRGVLTRSNALTEDVRIEIENLTGETWPMVVLDRVPYSEQEDLEITWQAQPRPDEQDVDGKRGVLSWAIDLPAGKTQAISLTHSLEWPGGMELQ